MDHAVMEQHLAQMASTSREWGRREDNACDAVARAYLDAHTEPQFRIGTTDFAADPLLICADRYFNLRLSADPTVRTAAACAAWIAGHIHPDHAAVIRERWGLGIGFITREAVQPLEEVTEEVTELLSAGTDPDTAWFVTLFLAGQRRAAFLFDDLASLLASPIAEACGAHRDSAVFAALSVFAAFGSSTVGDQDALAGLEQVWAAPDRDRSAVDLVLNGLSLSRNPDHAQLLGTHAAEAVKLYPGDHAMHYRLALAQSRCGQHRDALDAIDTALALLPAHGWRNSHSLLIDQYTSARLNIHNRASIPTVPEMPSLSDFSGIAMGWRVAQYALPTLIIGAVGCGLIGVNLAISGDLTMSERLWIVTASGGVLIVGAAAVLAIVWQVTRVPLRWRQNQRG